MHESILAAVNTKAALKSCWARPVDGDYLTYVMLVQKFTEFLTARVLASQEARIRFMQRHARSIRDMVAELDRLENPKKVRKR